jgi:hypothetical protein
LSIPQREAIITQVTATAKDDEHDAALEKLFASFLSAEPPYRRVVLAIGHTVIAAATLESVLSSKLLSLHGQQTQGSRAGLAKVASEVDRMTAGALLKALRTYGLSDALSERVAGVVERRNRLVHRPLQNPSLLAALSRGEGATEVASQILDLARDCDRLQHEVAPAAFEDFQSAFGITLPEALGEIEAFDASKLTNPRRRARVEELQRMLKVNPVSPALNQPDGAVADETSVEPT